MFGYARWRSSVPAASGEVRSQWATIPCGKPVWSACSCSQRVSSTGSSIPIAAWTWTALLTFWKRVSPRYSGAMYFCTFRPSMSPRIGCTQSGSSQT